MAKITTLPDRLSNPSSGRIFKMTQARRPSVIEGLDLSSNKYILTFEGLLSKYGHVESHLGTTTGSRPGGTLAEAADI